LVDLEWADEENVKPFNLVSERERERERVAFVEEFSYYSMMDMGKLFNAISIE
jgi:hypothetical protein